MFKFFAVTLLLMSSAVSSRADSEAEVMAEVLGKLKNPDVYSPYVRPSVNGEPTEVRLSTYIRDIGIDDMKMEVNFDLTFRMRWDDPRLAFSSRRVRYVNILTPHLAWLPDAFFKKAVTTQLKSIYPENYLRVFSDGHIVYSTRFMLKQRCPMNLALFPHDTQFCNITVASYGYTTKEVLFTATSDDIKFQDNLFVRKFTLNGFSTEFLTSETATGSYTSLQISLNLERVFRTYLLEWYVPVFMLLVVSWSSFFIPGEQFLGRILLSLLPLITLSSFINSFNKTLASVSYTRAIDLFSGMSICFSFAALINIIVNYVRRPDEEDSVIGGSGATGAKAIVIKYLPPIIHASCYLLFLSVYFLIYSLGA